MSSKAGNVTTTSQAQTAQTASVSQEFGDVSQYRELNAIGTGETWRPVVSQCASVPVCQCVLSLCWSGLVFIILSFRVL